MKNLVYLSAFLGLLALSCSDDSDPLCDVANVLDMPWMAELIEQEEQLFIGESYSVISSGTYRSGGMSKPQNVFILTNCCPNCLMLPPPVYDCSGNILGRVGTEGLDWEDIEDRKVIWKSSNNSCGT